MNHVETKTVEKTLEVNHIWQATYPDIATKALHKWEMENPRDKWKHSIDSSRSGFTTYRVRLIE